MSNVGQAALTIVGTVVGAYFGYPQLGFVLGSLAGQSLFPTQLPGVTGPKINDNNTTTASVGGAVSKGWGTFAVAGTVMYLAPLRTVSSTTTVGGKGGPEQQSTTFTYYQSIAIGLCEAAEGIRRIWENGTLVYDKRIQQVGEDDSSFNARVSANAKYEQNFVFYTGSEDQLPDPTIESIEGVGHVPAFRGLAYIMFPDRQLRDDQGLRHPSFRFEMFRTGTLIPVTAVNITVTGTGDILDAKLSDYADANLWNSKATILNISFVGAWRVGSTTVAPGFIFDQLKAGSQVNVLFHDSSAKQFWGMGGSGSGHFPNPGSTSPPPPTRTGFDPRPAGTGGTAVRFQADGPIDITIASDAGLVGTNTYMFGGGGGGGGMSSDGFSDSPGGGGAGYTAGTGAYGWYQGSSSIGPGDQSFSGGGGGSSLTPFPGGGRGGDLGQSGTDGNITGGSGGGPSVQYPQGSTWTVTTPYLSIYGIKQQYSTEQTGGISGTISTDPVSIREIINDVCVAATFNLTDIDSSEQADQFVEGYVLSTVMTARDALTPIRSVGFFDVVERDKKLYFSKRGKPIIDVLADEHMGAYADGDTPPASVTTTMTQDVDLPKQIRVHYIAPSRDYEAGEQLSPPKISTKAVQVTDVELAVSLKDDTAAQIAEILWADAWAGRWQHGTTLDREYLKYLPGDVIQIPVDGVYQRTRIDKIQDAVSGIRTLSLLRDDDGSYFSTAVAQQPLRGVSTLHVYAPTELIILDVPPLRFGLDNSADVFGAAHRHGTGNTWLGAAIFKSIDGGSSWNDVATVSDEAVIGKLVSPVGAGDPAYWDTANNITVDLDNGSFESRIESDVLGGANALAVGADGRWLIVQFKTATQLSTTPNRWKLTQLLQGRRGTEHLIGTSQANDHAVLVSGPGIIKLPISNAELGLLRSWRAVSSGTIFADGVDQSFAAHGVALLPFSPIDVEVSVNQSTLAITISWTRRDRLGQILREGTPLPMSESVKAFSIDIIDGANVSSGVVRTLTSSTESVVYTEDQQADDFSGRSASFSVEVYQVSSVVGRGTPVLTHASILANPNAVSGAGGGDPNTSTFAPDKNDMPITIGFNAASFIVARRGKVGTAPAVGIYRWDHSARTITLLGSTYDGRFGLTDSYVPDTFFSTIYRNIGTIIPQYAGGVDSEMSINWRRQVGSGTTAIKGRWLFNSHIDVGSMIDTGSVFDRDIVFMLRRSDGVMKAIVTGSPPHVWTSSTGASAWSDTAFCSGLPNLVYTDGDYIKPFQLADDSIVAQIGGTLYINANGDCGTWHASPIDSGGSPVVTGYSARQLIDMSYDGTAILAVMENTKISDGQIYNVLLRSDDGGYSWDIVREVLKSADVAPGFAFNLKWQIVVPFGNGFAIYGQSAFAGSFPYVMISTDHGVTFTTSEVDTGDATNGAWIQNAVSHGSLIMATDTNRTVNGVKTTRFSFSTDGITFTSISEFNQVSD